MMKNTYAYIHLIYNGEKIYNSHYKDKEMFRKGGVLNSSRNIQNTDKCSIWRGNGHFSGGFSLK